MTGKFAQLAGLAGKCCSFLATKPREDWVLLVVGVATTRRHSLHVSAPPPKKYSGHNNPASNAGHRENRPPKPDSMPTALEQVRPVQAEDKDKERERASRKNSFVCRNLVAKQPERLLRYSNCQRNCQEITNPEGKLSGVRRNFWGLLSSFPRFPCSSYLQP